MVLCIGVVSGFVVLVFCCVVVRVGAFVVFGVVVLFLMFLAVLLACGWSGGCGYVCCRSRCVVVFVVSSVLVLCWICVVIAVAVVVPLCVCCLGSCGCCFRCYAAFVVLSLVVLGSSVCVCFCALVVRFPPVLFLVLWLVFALFCCVCRVVVVLLCAWRSSCSCSVGCAFGSRVVFVRTCVVVVVVELLSGERGEEGHGF